MALLKLWNALRGRSASEASQSAQSSQSGSPKAAQAKPVQAKAAAAAPASSKPIANPKKKSSGPSLFGGGSVDPALMKVLRNRTAGTMLEIAVGDGTRAVEVLQLLQDNAAKLNAGDVEAVRYIAIDQFELGGGTATLKAFHQTMRSAGVRAQVFPESVDRGLMRVAHTVGFVDLILVSADAGDLQSAAWKSLLSRISHESSLILFQTGQSWQTLDLSELGIEPAHRRAA